MKKLWNNYCYVILFIGFSFLFMIIWVNHPTTVNVDDYVKIEINEGDTLWEIAEKYAAEHELSKKDFINWVKRTNGINETIYAGDKIVVPIKKDDVLIASSK